MYLKAIIATLVAWFVGLLIDSVPAIGSSCACGFCCLCWPWGFVSSAN